jgi:hypothetical protein
MCNTVTIAAQLKQLDGDNWKALCWAIERVGSTIMSATGELSYAVSQQVAQSPVHAYRRAQDGVIFHLHYVDGWRFDKIDAAATATLSPTPLRSVALRESAYEDALRAMESAIRIYDQERAR